MNMIDFDFFVNVEIRLDGVCIFTDDFESTDIDRVLEIIEICETIEKVVKRANKDFADKKSILEISIESGETDEDVTAFLETLLWTYDNEPLPALNKLREMAQRIAKFDDEQIGALIFFHENLENSLVDAFDRVINGEYEYIWDSGDPEDFVGEFMDIPSELADYIDYDNLLEDILYKSKWYYIEDYGYYKEIEE